MIPHPPEPPPRASSVAAAATTDGGLGDLLASVARIVAETIGFATVAIDLYRPAWDDFELLVVHGTESARTALLGRRRERAFLDELVHPRFERRAAYFVPQERRPRRELSYVPPLEASAEPGSWQPEDALFVPLRHSEGHLLGIVWLDEPEDGRQPTDEQLDVLVALAAQAAWAIEAAQEAAAAGQHGAALEELMRVSARLLANESPSEILEAVCRATRATLGFDVAAVEIADRETDRYRPLAAAGIALAEAAPLDVPLAVFDRVFDRAFELEGCYLLGRDEALARLGVDFSGHRSVASGRGKRAWNGHWLLVPLRDGAGDRIGFIWADDPRDRLLPSRPTLQALRLFADQAEAALLHAARVHALDEAAEEKRTLLEASPLAIVHLGADRTVRSWNSAAREMFGYPDELVLGKEPPWIPAGQRVDFRLRFDAQFEHEVSHAVYVDQRADGSLLEVETTSAPLRAPDGSPAGMIAVLADITEQEEAKRELARRAEETRAMLDSSPVALMRLDREGRTLWWSPAAERIFGWSAEETVGRRPLFVPEAAQGQFEETLAHILAGGSITGSERTRVRKDGTEIEIRLSASPVYAADGAVDGVMAALEDVTEANQTAGHLAARNAELEAMHETTVAVVGELAVDHVLEQIVSHSSQLLGAANGFLSLVDRTERLIPVVRRGGYANGGRDVCPARGEGLSGRVWLEKRALKIDDYATWRERIPALENVSIRALACAPLVEAGEVIGVLGVSHDDTAAVFDDDDLRLLERFAHLASVALRNARLHETAQRELAERTEAERETARRNAELEALHETALRLSEQRESTHLLADIVARAAGLAGTEHGWLYLLEGDELVFECGTGVFGQKARVRAHRHAGLAGRVVATGCPFTVDDYSSWPDRVERFDNAGLRAVCGVPLYAGNEVVGVLGVGHDRPEVTFGDAEIALLTRFARLASLALENARLHDAARHELAERTEAERQLFRAKEYSDRLLETANALVAGLDCEGRTVVFNEEAERVTGYKKHELDDAILFETIFSRAANREIWAAFDSWAAGTGTMPETFETTVLTRAGETRRISWRNREVVFEGERRGLLAFGIDVTEQRQIEEQLRHAQKLDAIGQLTGGIAHDFNNLLTAINGYGELALATLPTGDPARDCVEQMVRAGDRASGLTRQLLAFGRRQVLRSAALDLSAIVQGLEPMLSRLLGEQVELVLDLDGELGAAIADPGQIEQVVVNLAINARDAMPRGGKLLLRTENAELDDAFALKHPGSKPGSYVALSVSDDGVGMDERTLARAFEPFFTTKPVGQGTGLGLSTVYGIVKQSDGTIWAYSEPGRGTTFTLYLPRVSAAVGELEPQPTSAPRGRGTGTVLLVEDDRLVRTLAERLLADAGYTVIAASHPADAERIALDHNGTIGLLVTDIVMPGMSGPELAERLLATRPDLPVLFTSGHAREALAEHGELLRNGAAFLQKPFTSAGLRQKVHELLNPADA